MKRVLLAVAAMVFALACATHAGAQEDRGYWHPASTNARAITGQIDISESKVTIDFWSFPLARIRRLKPAEVSAVFDADINAGIEGTLYRLHVPAGQRFEHKNTLCADSDTQWMATYATGRTLNVAFFSGDDLPVFTFDAIQNTSTLCGAFSFAR